jgi:hypothetical protein
MSIDPPFLDNFCPRWSDLQAILILDPNHREARELLPLPGGKMPTRIDHVSRLLPYSYPATGPQSCTGPYVWVPTLLE